MVRILPPAKELPPQAFQSPNGACSCATAVACGRLILRPARLQIQSSRSLGNPIWRTLEGEGRYTRGPFGGVTPGVTAQRADGGKWILMGLVAFVWGLGQSAYSSYSARSPRGHMQRPGLHLRQCNAALRPLNFGSDASWRASDDGAIPAEMQAFDCSSIRQTPLGQDQDEGMLVMSLPWTKISFPLPKQRQKQKQRWISWACLQQVPL